MNTDGQTCIDCGRLFERSHPYRGNYCEECREAYTDE